MAGGNIGSFEARMKRRAKMVRVGADRAVQRAAFAILNTAVFLTPIDTGKAKFNWSVSLDTRPIGRFPKPPRPEAGAPAALTRGLANLAGYTGGKGKQIHIHNNLDYVVDLNRNHAAAGFAYVALLAGINRIQRTTVFVRL